MFAPTIAELYDKGEMQKLSTMVKIVTKWSIVFSLPIFGIATIFSYFLLSISGDSFSAAWPLLIMLSVGNMVNTGTGSTNYLLYMTGKQKFSFINSFTAIAVNVGVGVILTPRYGAMGTAISTGLGMAVLNLVALLQVRLLLKIQPYRWDVLKPFIAGAVSAALIGGLLYLFARANVSIQLPVLHLPFQLLFIPVFLAIYIGVIILLKISPEDEIVLDALRKKLKRA
jgi:O-antigen/teichoic acid export membrane protein